MDIKSFGGKPLFSVIDEICRGVTDADQWAIFQGCIGLSEHQVISIGGDFMRWGIRIIGRPEPQKTKSEIDAEAYAAALRPLFAEFVSCALVARCRPIAPASGGQEFDFPGDGWEDPWKLIIEGKRATLIDEAGNKHKVLSLRLGSEAHPAMQATAAEPVATTPQGTTRKGKGGRPQEYDWNGAEIALTSYFNEEGTPMPGYGEQAKAEKFMAAWFERKENGGKVPPESLIREHVTKLVEILERERKRPKTQFPAFPADKKR